MWVYVFLEDDSVWKKSFSKTELMHVQLYNFFNMKPNQTKTG